VTAKVTPENEWAGANLRAFRAKKRLTQEELADAARIDRSAYVNLEAGRRKITMTYAERLAPELGIADPVELLPPPAPEEPMDSPLDRLRELEEKVEERQRQGDVFAQEVIARLAALEAAQGIATPGSTPLASEQEE